MRRRTKGIVLIGTTVLLLIVVAPVVPTSNFAYTVQGFPGGCVNIYCDSYNVNQVCYETLVHYVLCYGLEICHDQNETQ